MPFKVEKRGEKFCVVNPETGKVYGEHDTEAEAESQQRALYANAPPEKERKDGSLRSVRRFDVLERLDGPKLLPNGWLKADAFIARTGIQEYRRGDGSTRRELRPAETVFDSTALESFAMVPVTDNHPDEGFLTAENTGRYQRGHLGESVRRDGEKVRASILVTDGELVKAILAGKQQLSCGYTCDLDETPGEWQGQRFDAVQRNVRGNHVAVVDAARGGPEVRVKLDTADAVSIRGDREQEPSSNPSEERQMVKITVDGIEVEVANDQAAQLIGRALKAREDARDGAQKAAQEAREEVAKVEKTAKAETEAQRARADVAEAKVKEVEKARTDAAANFPAAVKARVDLESKAREVLGADATFDGKNDREVKALVVAKLSPDLKLDGESDAYVDAVYRGTMATATSEALARLRAAAKGSGGGSREDAPPDAEAARRKAREDAEKEWQKPLSATRS